MNQASTQSAVVKSCRKFSRIQGWRSQSRASPGLNFCLIKIHNSQPVLIPQCKMGYSTKLRAFLMGDRSKCLNEFASNYNFTLLMRILDMETSRLKVRFTLKVLIFKSLNASIREFLHPCMCFCLFFLFFLLRNFQISLTFWWYDRLSLVTFAGLLHLVCLNPVPFFQVCTQICLHPINNRWIEWSPHPTLLICWSFYFIILK